MFVDIVCLLIVCLWCIEIMFYEIGEKCEGFYDGWWYLCIILS